MRQAKLRDIVALRRQPPDWRVVRIVLVIAVGVGLLGVANAVSALVATAPTDPTSPTFYIGLLIVSVAVAAGAAVPFVVRARRRRHAVAPTGAEHADPDRRSTRLSR